MQSSEEPLPEEKELENMALTRKMLKGMGIAEEQADTIIEAHSETVDGLKERLKTAEESASKLETVQKELDALKAKGEDGYKEKYEKEHKAFEDYKADVSAKEAKAAKEKAARAYLESKAITGDNLDIAMMAISGVIDRLELEGGKISDTSELDDLVGGKLSRLVVTTTTRGANTSTPPVGNASKTKLTRNDIYKKDDNGRFVMDAEQRQKALSEIIAAEQQKG